MALPYSGLVSKVIPKLRMLISEIEAAFLFRFPTSSDKTNILQEVVISYRKNQLSPSEFADIEYVETLRAAMLNSNETMAKMEYGAGSVSFENQGDREKVSEVCRIASKKREPCLLLYHIIRSLHPEHALELGTCLGVSAAYQGMALRHNGIGKMITIEGGPARAGVAASNIKKSGLDDFVEVIAARFQDVLGPQLKQLGFVDYAFIDGHHQEDATLQYFKEIAPYFKKGGIMIFDDIFWSKGMNNAWQTIKASGIFSAIMVYKGLGIGFIAPPGNI